MLTLSLRPHRRWVLGPSEQPQKLFVLIRLRPEAAAGETSTAVEARVAVMVAVDTSGSMYAHLPGGASKIDRAIESLAALGQLAGIEHDTALGIVQFDSQSTVLMPLTELDPRARSRLVEESRRLRNFGGGTNLAQGLQRVRDQLSAVREGTVTKAIVVTDGETTDEGDCLSLAQTFAEAGTPLICIGLGADYNEDFLAALADRTNGFLYHLSESETSLARLRTALEQALLQSKRELYTDLRLELSVGPGLALDGLTRVYPMVQPLLAGPDGVFRLGNAGRDDPLVLVAELTLPAQPVDERAALHAMLRYDVPSRSRKGVELHQGVSVEYTSDPARAADLDEEVIFFVQQARASAQAAEAVRLTQSGRLDEARRSIMALEALGRRLGNPQIARAAERAAVELAISETLMPETAKAMKVGAKTLTILSPPTRQQRAPDTIQ
jgi:Ca-activated chloride channel family protein